VEKTIQTFHMFGPQDRVLVAVSGGKDSLTLWDVLLTNGYRAEGLYINLAIPDNGYSDESEKRARAFAESRGASLQVVNIRDTYGMSVPELARRRLRGQKVCSLCGLVKRHVMNRVACDGGYAAIATGHNTDDEAAVLLQNTLHWQAGYLARQSPVLPSSHPRLARKVKPLCLTYERESAAYALVRGIDYIYDECPYSVGARSLFLKEVLNQIESRSTGAKFEFYREFLRARESGAIAVRETEAEALHDCTSCGQPTTAPGLCAFCRLWAQPATACRASGDETP
jgi:uncharacterized protein (TIGR00269 family)